VNNESDDDESGDESDDESGDESDDELQVELVWCQGQCGKNFHKHCLDEWIRFCDGSHRTSTCPNWYAHSIF
jgi:hypothetical protein